MKKSNFIKDIVINFISVILPIAVLQLLALPIIANTVGLEKYGVIIVLISIFTIVGKPLGNTLNNIRLIDKKGNDVFGDYNVLLLSSSFIASIIIILISLIYFPDQSLINIIFLVIIVLLSIVNDYLIVSFRLKLNYKKIFLYNMFLTFGYLLGTMLFVFISYWEIIYLIGLLFSFLFLIINTGLLNEPFSKTQLFKLRFKDFSILYSSSLLRNMLNYADRIILLPLLGSSEVSVYYAASIIGKLFSMIIQPISTVILSYLVRMKKIAKREGIKFLFMLIIIGIFSYVLIIWISPFMLNTLYPEWASESLAIINITAATAIIQVFASIISPFNLAFNSFKWQIYINGSNFILYFIITLYLTARYSLQGFIIAVLISALYIFLLQIYIYLKQD